LWYTAFDTPASCDPPLLGLARSSRSRCSRNAKKRFTKGLDGEQAPLRTGAIADICQDLVLLDADDAVVLGSTRGMLARRSRGGCTQRNSRRDAEYCRIESNRGPKQTFSNISRNGVTLNGIATRGNEDFSRDLPQIPFSVPKETRQNALATVLSKSGGGATGTPLCGGTVQRTIFCE
jgi:hypothetical protein